MQREKWIAYPYSPVPEQQYSRGACESLRHRHQSIPARFLELIYEQEQETLLIRQAWRTCDVCHAEIVKHRARVDGGAAPSKEPAEAGARPYVAGPRRPAGHRR
jgi:hypothetical protein